MILECSYLSLLLDVKNNKQIVVVGISRDQQQQQQALHIIPG